MACSAFVPAAAKRMSPNRGCISSMNCCSSEASLAETRHSSSPGTTVFMPIRCILACSPAPMKAMLFESGRARCLAARAPIAPTRTLEHRVPSMKAMGKPRSISDRTITADRFCMPYFSGLRGNTDTHLTPHTFSGSRVAGRQLIRSWVSSLKICTTLSGKRISSLRKASMAFSAALMASRISRQPASRRSSCERKRHSMRFLSVMVSPLSAVRSARDGT